MKHGKKLLSLLLSIVMAVGLLPTSVLAATGETFNVSPPSGYSVTNNADLSALVVTPSQTQRIPWGTNIEPIIITPKENYKFPDGWDINDLNTQMQAWGFTITRSGNTLTITGTLNPDKGYGSVNLGDTATFTAWCQLEKITYPVTLPQVTEGLTLTGRPSPVEHGTKYIAIFNVDETYILDDTYITKLNTTLLNDTGLTANKTSSGQLRISSDATLTGPITVTGTWPAMTKKTFTINTPTFANATVTNNNTAATYGEAIDPIIITPAANWKFDTSADLTALNDNLSSYGLTAAWDGRSLKITGTLTGELSNPIDLTGLSDWPNIVEDAYPVKLGTLPAGLNCTSNNLDTTVTANQTYTATFTVEDTQILDAAYVNALNTGILNGTGLTAELDGTGLKISGTITGTVDLSGATWPPMTQTEAMIGDTKYDSLSAAIGEAGNGQTVVMKKAPGTAVNDAALANGAILQDTDSNTYTAAADSTQISVDNTGKVTLTEGKLNVSQDGSVAVTKDGKNYTVTGTAPKSGFTVDAGTAKVTVAGSGSKVSNGNGLTFTAGAAGSTFPLAGNDLRNGSENDAITVSKDADEQTITVGTKFTEEGDEVAVSVTVPASNTQGDVTVKKGDGENAMATVTVSKAGDRFEVGGTPYTAAADDTTFTIDANGEVTLTSGGIALGDGQSVNGIVSRKPIANPAGSNGDQVTVVGKGTYDEVTVPTDGKVTIDGKEYINGGADDLVLHVAADGTVSVASGKLTATIAEGSSLVGMTSGAAIANPAGSGGDTLTVVSDSEKDTVTVPGGEGGSVTITKDGKDTTYTNGDATTALVIDVPKTGGASLSSGSVTLATRDAIGVNGNTITNTSTAPLTIKKDDGSGTAVIENLEIGQSFTDKDGNTYTARVSGTTFEVDENGSIRLKSGSATVTPAAGETTTVKVAKNGSAAAGSDFYPVSGSDKFIVTAGKGDGSGSEGNDKATVTIPTKDASVTVGESADKGLTFTAGAADSTFPLDGSKLSGDGDRVVVGKNKTDDTVITVQDADASVTPNLPEIKVTVPSANTGDTTVTKGQPTIVKIGANDDTFKVGETSYPIGGGAKVGEEYAINMATGEVSKVEAKLWNANGTLANYGSLDDMLSGAASGQSVEMITAPETAISDVPVETGVKITDLDGDEYTVVGGTAKVGVGTDGVVTLENGKLTSSMGGTVKTDEYTVTGTDIEDSFTVSADSAEGLYQVTIGNKNGSISNGKNLTFKAGAANSTFDLSGGDLSGNANGDSVTIGAALNASKDVKLSDDVTVQVPDNSGDTTITKGQPAGFIGSVTLKGNGDSFTVGGETYHFNDGGMAETEATFGIRADGTVAMLDGSTELSDSGEEVEVQAEGWTGSVSVSTPSDNSHAVLVTANSPAAAVVKSGDSVTIGDKTYKALEDTTFNFDANGKVTLAAGKAELDKDESILGGVGKLEIKNTSEADAAKVTVKSIPLPEDSAKDIVTVPEGGKVTIGGKEYTNSGSGEMTLEIDAQGNVTLTGGEADYGKNTALKLNGTTITNTGDSALTLTENGDSDTLDVKQGGSFTVGSGTVKEPSADMSFTVAANGTLTAILPDGESVTINGVKYTGGDPSATLTMDKDGNLSISGAYTANIPGKTTHEVIGRVMEASSGVAGATVTLTQGGKESVKLATVTTDGDGYYKFPAVPAGTYNVVVVTPGGKTMTKLVTVGDGDVNMGNLDLPTNSISSIVEVTENAPVGAMVGGLNTEAEAQYSSGDVKITLTVDQGTPNASIAALPEASGKALLPLEITISKSVGLTTSSITTTNSVLEIILSFDTSNKTNITVFRKHGIEDAEVLRKLSDRPTDPAQYEDGTYYVGNGFVVVYTKKFSPYVIGYNTVSNSGSSGGSSAGAGINVGKTGSGSVSVSPKNASKGETVTITVKPDAGYKLGSLTVTDKNGNQLTLTKISDTQYSFVAPGGKVDVKAAFVKTGTNYTDCPKDSTCPVAAFTDTLPTAWYHDGVHYCVDNGLMGGYSNKTFAPNRATTRAQIVVMLWRLNGSPVVGGAVGFTDVAENAWCADAIRWAKSVGIAGGYKNGTFRPNETMTREQMVTFLYRYAQSMSYDVSVGESTNILSFADALSVSEYAIPAMQWGCGSGMMGGKRDADGAMILMPQGTTTRAQMATMLMRFCAEIVK